MKIKLVPISESTVAKIYYLVDTGLALYRTISPDNFSQQITILKKNSKQPNVVIIEKGLDLRDENSKVLVDLQKYIDTSDPIIGTVEVNSIEFLSNEYFKSSFKLEKEETKNLLKELDSLNNPKGYNKAIDLYNDLIAL